MKTDDTAQRELARQLIEAMGKDNACDIARRNCWKGVLDELKILEPSTCSGFGAQVH